MNSIACGKYEVAHAKLDGSKFHDVGLAGAVFDDVFMFGASFNNVSMIDAKLNDINLANVRITNCNIAGMTIDGINVAEALAAHRQRYANGNGRDEASTPRSLCEKFSGVWSS